MPPPLSPRPSLLAISEIGTGRRPRPGFISDIASSTLVLPAPLWGRSAHETRPGLDQRVAVIAEIGKGEAGTRSQAAHCLSGLSGQHLVWAARSSNRLEHRARTRADMTAGIIRAHEGKIASRLSNHIKVWTRPHAKVAAHQVDVAETRNGPLLILGYLAPDDASRQRVPGVVHPRHRRQTVTPASAST